MDAEEQMISTTNNSVNEESQYKTAITSLNIWNYVEKCHNYSLLYLHTSMNNCVPLFLSIRISIFKKFFTNSRENIAIDYYGLYFLNFHRMHWVSLNVFTEFSTQKYYILKEDSNLPPPV